MDLNRSDGLRLYLLRSMDIEKLIKQNKCTILDVRSEEEYSYGNVAGSINISLGDIVERLEEIKGLKTSQLSVALQVSEVAGPQNIYRFMK